MRALALAVGAAIALAACAAPLPNRLARSVDAMERLRGARFSIEAKSVASGAQALGGELALSYRGAGELVPPDRLRLLLSEPQPAELVIVGDRAWRDGRRLSRSALRTLAHPLAILETIREGGSATFAGLGLSRGALTLRYRIDRGGRGVIDVELGVADDLVRRQSFTLTEGTDGDPSGLTDVRTSYTVEYWDLGAPLEVREPE